MAAMICSASIGIVLGSNEESEEFLWRLGSAPALVPSFCGAHRNLRNSSGGGTAPVLLSSHWGAHWKLRNSSGWENCSSFIAILLGSKEASEEFLWRLGTAPVLLESDRGAIRNLGKIPQAARISYRCMAALYTHTHTHIYVCAYTRSVLFSRAFPNPNPNPNPYPLPFIQTW